MSELRVACPDTLDHESGRTLWENVYQRDVSRNTTLVVDFSATERMDSLGGAWLVKIAEHVGKRKAVLKLVGQSGQVAELLDMVEPALQPASSRSKARAGFLETLGERTLSVLEESRDFAELCVDAVYWTIIAPLEGRGFRWNILIDEIHEMGVRAIKIVCLMNFLLGLIIAMLMAKQSEAYGISIFVADIVMIGFARELAAIMTAVVVSARTGAAIAAEIATMKVQEEIDALRGMGLNVNQFLVAPKLLALLLVLPCLVALGIVSGVAGGALWGIAVLGFQPSIWFTQTLNSAYTEDLVQGFLKTIIFALGIVLIGCHNGFRVSGGSRGVGLMTTRAVVMDIFMLITCDIVFAAVFYYILG
ncbi:MAG: ABC transporter permease [Candidatus Hydrogenedentes bacterium]|nr:ABC transporter permease [Candidatus Hydrogenedentota bacterium]